MARWGAPEDDVAGLAVDVDRRRVVVAAPHLVRVRRVLGHALLPDELAAWQGKGTGLAQNAS